MITESKSKPKIYVHSEYYHLWYNKLVFKQPRYKLLEIDPALQCMHEKIIALFIVRLE